jgi:hypothetical protein
MANSTQTASLQVKARFAGAFYVLAAVSGILVERFVHGKALYAAGLIPVLSFAVTTVLLWQVLKPVSSRLALLALAFNLCSLTLEALEWHFMGANVALAFHGLYGLLIGYLMYRSAVIPRVLGACMFFSGLCWLTDLSIPLTDHLAPYNVVAGFLGEGLPMLWLLILGIKSIGARGQPYPSE